LVIGVLFSPFFNQFPLLALTGSQFGQLLTTSVVALFTYRPVFGWSGFYFFLFFWIIGLHFQYDLYFSRFYLTWLFVLHCVRDDLVFRVQIVLGETFFIAFRR